MAFCLTLHLLTQRSKEYPKGLLPRFNGCCEVAMGSTLLFVVKRRKSSPFGKTLPMVPQKCYKRKNNRLCVGQPLTLIFPCTLMTAYDYLHSRCLRERSLLILGARAQDNFAQLGKISYPILNMEIVLVPHHLSAKWFCTPCRSLCAKNIDLWKDTKLSLAIFIPSK